MSIETLVSAILDKMPEINKWQRKFLQHLFWLQLSLRGRYNFENMARYGIFNESTYRHNYSRYFDFITFNQHLINKVCSDERIVAFDPCFIQKSGKHTAGINYFWSGCAGQTKKGLEIGGFACVDIVNRTALHLTAQQTLEHKEYDSLLDYYSALVCTHAESIKTVSDYLVVDAYFSKRPFVDAVIDSDLQLISRFRDDVVLFYPYVGPPSKGRGRPKVYDGKVNVKQLSDQHFSLCVQESHWNAYQGRVYAKALKRWVRVVIVQHFDNKGNIKKVKIYFATDLNLQGETILLYYRNRFQIEFLYRDAKQFVGLQQCQSREETRLDFHFNTALTTVSLAKALHYLDQDWQERKPFSMASIKAQYFNELMLEKIFIVCGRDPNEIKNNPDFIQLRELGKITA